MIAALLNPQVLIGAAVALASAAGGGAYVGHEYSQGKHAAAALERKAVIDDVRRANLDLADGISKGVEVRLAKLRVTNTTINNEVRHEREVHREVLENPDCRVPASTVRVLNRATGAERGNDQPATGESGSGVRGPGPAVRP